MDANPDTSTSLHAATVFPGVGAAYSHGWNTIWKYFLKLLLVVVVFWILHVPTTLLQVPITLLMGDDPGLGWAVGFAYLFLVVSPIYFGTAYVYLKAVRGETFKVTDIFTVFNNYLNAVLAFILGMLISMAGFILLIVPGIIFACRLAFVPYLVVDRKLDAVAAIKESWRLTRGHTWTIFGIYMLAIPIYILGMLALGVGAIISGMWFWAAHASLYYAVSGRPEPVDRDTVPLTP